MVFYCNAIISQNCNFPFNVRSVKTNFTYDSLSLDNSNYLVSIYHKDGKKKKEKKYINYKLYSCRYYYYNKNRDLIKIMSFEKSRSFKILKAEKDDDGRLITLIEYIPPKTYCYNSNVVCKCDELGNIKSKIINNEKGELIIIENYSYKLR